MNKLFNVCGKGSHDGLSMVPQQVLDTLEVTLVLQVICSGDKDTPVYDSCLLVVKKYCKELGYSRIIKIGGIRHSENGPLKKITKKIMVVYRCKIS